MKTKYCIIKHCNREATIWKGRLLKGRDAISSAGFCAEHSYTKCPNLFGKPNVYDFETKDMVMISDSAKPIVEINTIEQ